MYEWYLLWVFRDPDSYQYAKGALGGSLWGWYLGLFLPTYSQQAERLWCGHARMLSLAGQRAAARARGQTGIQTTDSRHNHPSPTDGQRPDSHGTLQQGGVKRPNLKQLQHQRRQRLSLARAEFTRASIPSPRQAAGILEVYSR